MNVFVTSSRDPFKKGKRPQVENQCSKRCHHFQCLCISSWNLWIRPQIWGCKILRRKWKWIFAVFGWFLLSWYLAMCQIFCCSIIHGVSFNYQQRNVRSRVSVSNSSRNLSQVSVSEVTVSTTSLNCLYLQRRELIYKAVCTSSVRSWFRKQLLVPPA